MKHKGIKVSVIALLVIAAMVASYFAYQQHAYKTMMDNFFASSEKTVEIANTQGDNIKDSMHIIKQIWHDSRYDIDKEETTRFVYDKNGHRYKFKKAMAVLQKDKQYKKMFDELKQANKDLEEIKQVLNGIVIDELPNEYHNYYGALLTLIHEYQGMLDTIIDVDNQEDMENYFDRAYENLNDTIAQFQVEASAITSAQAD